MAAMIVAALVETARLRIVDNNNLQNVDYTITPVPMSIWWQVSCTISKYQAAAWTGCDFTQYMHSLRACMAVVY